MDRTATFHLGMGLIGLSLGAVALNTLSGQGLAVGSLALAAGSAILLAQTIYALIFADSRGSVPRRMTWVVAVAALLSLAGALLVLVP